MGTGYKLVPLAQAQPGMVLSDVLLDRVGQMLLPKGATLTAATLASLRRHGVTMLPLVSGAPAEPADQGRTRARLDHLFRDHASDATGPAAALRRMVAQYRREREAP